MALPSNPDSVDPQKTFTVREAADILGVTPDTVKGYCRTKRLRSRKVGPKRAWAIPGAEIRRLLKDWNAG
jgi:excisionase family DNA binding protein